MDLPGSEMRASFIGRTMYTGWTLLGKVRWLKESDSHPAATERFMPGPGGPNPDQLLGILIKASKNIETLGNDEIRGVATKHYRAHINRKELGQDASYPPGELVIDAWIDEDGLARRLRLPDSDTSTTTIDLYDFGVEVDVEAPRADEIITDEEFTKLAEEECAHVPNSKRRDNFVCLLGAGFSGSSEVQVETVPQEETER
jgi:hypothetical protein